MGSVSLTETHRRGEKAQGDLLIGAEHELLCITQEGRVPGYGGPSGIGAVLQALGQALGWSPTMEGEHAIGLQGETASVTLEPGGQLELAGSPCTDLHAVANEVRGFHTLLGQIAQDLELQFFGLGLRPLAPLAGIPTMPKSRYAIMKRVMPTLGRRSLEMMFSTATVQTNLDYRDEADMARKFRAAACLSPIAAALFANSPYQNGQLTGRMTERYAIWDDTDTERSGRFAWMVDQPLTYQAYSEWAKGLRLLFLYRQGLYQDAGNTSFANLLDQGLVDESDWQQHLGGIFPEVRLKNFLELRSADGGCGQMVVALNAFWTGLLYDEQALSDALALCEGWESTGWERMARAAATDALAAETDFGPMLELTKEVLRIADAGLQRRGRVALTEKDERTHLAPLHALVHMGASQAELLVKRFGNDAEAARCFATADLWEFPW